MFLSYTWHAYIVLHLSRWLHSCNSPCTILHAKGHSPLRIYGYLWLLTNRSGSGLVLHEAMHSALLRLSEFSCLRPNRNNRPRHCRRNRMGLVRVLFVLLFCASLCKEDNSYSSLLLISIFHFWIFFKLLVRGLADFRFTDVVQDRMFSNNRLKLVVKFM